MIACATFGRLTPVLLDVEMLASWGAAVLRPYER
jgi:hypothetical protein